MKIVEISESTKKQATKNGDPINIFCQFFIHKNPARQKEIVECLKFNVNNKFINKIYLLNEMIYNDNQLGVVSDKIVQYNVGKRLMFYDVYKYILDNDIKGYNVVINSDIFFDNTIENLCYSDIHINKKMYALLRYEYNRSNIKKSLLFGPRFDSQDTWIIHSNHNIKQEWLNAFKFEFGKPGCDNKLIYIMKILGYSIINDPSFIKSYHNHESQQRDYSNKDVIGQPWGFVVPANTDLNLYQPVCGIDFKTIKPFTKNFTEVMFDDNTKLYNYILNKFSKKKLFIIPRIAGIENMCAFVGELISKGQKDPNLLSWLNARGGVMKKNAGIKLSNEASHIKYSKLYLKSFMNCDLFTGWEIQGDVYRGISQSQDYIRNGSNKKMLWAFAMDIYHYIYSTPWTFALKGKRVLIISAFEDSIKEKIPIREKIYGVDLFPDCELLTIKPPQTQGDEDSEEFDIEFEKFQKKLDAIKDTYDVALVSCGGYGNLVCNYIFEKHNKSAIYIGGVLQMYFGILGSRWFRERSDVLRLFMNSNWSRPKETEKPKSYQNVESSCYW